MRNVRGYIRRNSVTFGFAIIAVALGTILFFQTLALSQVQREVAGQQQIVSQIKGVTESLNQKAADRTTQFNDLNNHINCIVQFFAQPDRATKSITDIDTCTLKSNATGQTQTVPTQKSTTSGTSAAPSSTPTGSGTSNTSNTSPSVSSTPTTSATPSGGSSQPVPFLQRTIVDPIKSIINAL